MPNTPQVNIQFKNENPRASVPLTGVSHFVARTTKGKFNDPSELISSWAQFQRLFGEEVVPDGSISNIRKALEIGSKIRVSRVAGSTASYGYAGTDATVEEVTTHTVVTFEMVLTSASDSNSTVSFQFKLRTKEQGSAFDGSYDNLYLKFILDTNSPKHRIILRQSADPTAPATGAKDIDFIAWNPTTKNIDYQTLLNFVNMAENVDIEVVSFRGLTTYDIYGVLTWMADNPEYLPADAFVTATVYSLPKGSDGGNSTAETWQNAYKAIAEYTDAYCLYLSHVHQHLEGYQTLYATIAGLVKAAAEEKLMVELPKPTVGTSLATYLSALKTLVGAVGQSEFICYFGGGIKYYDDLGVIRNCDVLGSVAGLHDVCAATHGPWYSPAGQNRGVIAEALGPVMQNLGTPNMKADLQAFADWYMNLFVIKDTQYQGKRTMLWHNFTSSPNNDSSRFISITNLNLYIKKTLRPILEGYLEEPNIFATWKNIFYAVKPILDDLVTRQAMSEYEWLGDQNAQSYADLQINTEADVRQGKYKAKLRYKDIVTLQDISLDVIISQADGTVSFTTE